MSQQLPMGFLLPETSWSVPSELPDMRGRGLIAIDTETKDDGLAAKRGSGWAYRAGHIVGVSMAAPGCEAVYIPIRHPETDCFDPDQVGRWVADHMASPDTKVFHSAHYDLGWLWAEWGITVVDGVADTMAAAALLEEERLSYSLGNLCAAAGIAGKDEESLRLAASAYRVDPKAGLWRLPARYVGGYAAQDAAATLELWQWQQPRIAGEGMHDALRTECELIPMVVEMRKRGIRVDTRRAEEVQAELKHRSDEILAEISRRVSIGRALRISDLSSPAMMEKLHDEAGVQYPRTPKTGRGSFSKEWMDGHDHWLPSMAHRALVAHSMADKFIGKYIIDYTHRGRIHAEIRQYRSDDGGTRTSRFAYADPPLQQMPTRGEDARLVREAFVPEEGEVWGKCDVSQQEYRLIVHFAESFPNGGLPGAREAGDRYRSDPRTDFHTMVADMTGLDRKKAKDTNFAKSFGAGVPKFAAMTNKTLEEAQAIMDQYDERLPFNSELGSQCQNAAKNRGYIVLIDGTRAHFDRWEPQRWGASAGIAAMSRVAALEAIADENHPWYRQRIARADTRKAMNKLIQGSAARQTKIAMRDCWREGLCPLLQLHDELDFSVAERGTAERVRDIMQDAVKLKVPVISDLTYGTSWGGATKTWEETICAQGTEDNAD